MKAIHLGIRERITLGLVTILFFTSTGYAATWYVDSDHLISGDGTSWHEAVLTIQEAVSLAASWDEIWVREGVYNLSSTITINDRDLLLYGGFSGYETSLDQRDWVKNETIIDGTGYASTCIYITADQPTIDGFTVRNCTDGAMYMWDCFSEVPILQNMVFADNGSDEVGSRGGAINLFYCSPKILNTTFWNNQAGLGGAIFVDCGVVAHITNCTFSNNSASNGGAVYASGCGASPPHPTITNSILWGDSATSEGPEIDGPASVGVYHSDIDQAGYDFNNNIRQDPLIFGTERPHLRHGSPAIDMGNNTAIYIPSKDFDGDSRIIDGDENGVALADMGADEFVPGATFGVWYVDSGVATSGFGTSWNEALKTIEEAVSYAIAGDEIWVKAGTYMPTGGAVIAPLHITQAGIELYGGFAGGESQRDQRDWLSNETIIDGQNSFTRTIYVSGSGGGATIDGFTITGGGSTAAVEFAGVSGVNTVANCKFTANSKTSLKSTSSDLQVLKSRFVGNTWAVLSSTGTGKSLTVTDTLFSNNSAVAVVASNATFIDRCKFIENVTAGNGAAISIHSTLAQVNVANSLFVGNEANTANNNYIGGAIYINYNGLLSVKNSTFYGNSAAGTSGTGGAIGAIDWHSAFTVDNSILWGNTAEGGSGTAPQLRGSPVVTYSNVDQDGFTGAGNIRVAPIFADSTDPDPLNWDYRPGSSSPVIDSGDNSIHSSCSTDLNVQQRFLDDPLVIDTGIGSGSIIDMGAYERQVGAVADQYDLTMAVVGNGTTVPAAGVYSYPVCSTVELEAVAGSGSLFANWTGNVANALAPQTHITMTGNQSATATFSKKVTLTVELVGSGTGTISSTPAGIDCGLDCSQEFDTGTSVTLSTAVNSDTAFNGWVGGGCSGTGDCELTMAADSTVSALLNLKGTCGSADTVILEDMTVETDMTIEACTSIRVGNGFTVVAPASVQLITGNSVEIPGSFSVGYGATFSIYLNP